MADTAYPVGHSMAVQKWSPRLMKETLKKTQMLKFMGPDNNSVFHVKNSLKDYGYRETFGLRMQLAGDGTSGDDVLEGNEESLTIYSDSVDVDQLRHAVRSKGKASEQRVPFETRKEALDGLSDWWAGRIDTTAFNHLAGISTETRPQYNGNNTIQAPSSTHIVYPNGETSEANCSDSANSRFYLSLIDDALEKAKTLSPQINPIMYQGKEYYVCFLHPYQVKDLRTDASTSRITWYGTHQAAMQGGQIKNNPIFTGALGEYNGVILHESTYVPLAPGYTACRRAVFTGAQAGAVAFGKGYGKNTFSWKEKLFDYDNKLGVSAGLIWGMKKCQFNSADFASIVISTGAA